jgi:predicted metal-binding membrane protein
VSWGAELCAWLAMVVAMMLPLQLDAVRVAAFRSLRRRRQRAAALFVLGYLAPWAALGAAVAWLRSASWPAAHADAAAAAAFALAALWTLTAARRRALVACHRTVPLAPTGWRADRDCVGYGARVGAACAASCWATMLGCALTGHALLAMVGGAAIAARERLAFRTPHRTVLVATAGLAAWYALAALRG